MIASLVHVATLALYAVIGLAVIAALGIAARLAAPVVVHALVPLLRAVVWPWIVRPVLLLTVLLAVRYAAGATFWPWDRLSWTAFTTAPARPRRTRRGLVRWRDWAGWERATVRLAAPAAAAAATRWPVDAAGLAAAAGVLLIAWAVRQRYIARQPLPADMPPRVVPSRAGPPRRPRTGPPLHLTAGAAPVVDAELVDEPSRVAR
ncbi:hypothetical protein [Dactylosporangium sp. CS-033363]|uniref:hypothetical protein n=1 Tax=Dactylosporangium sp. CS-033363 TaxID=3239935 RepID=UPI003D926BC9